MERQNHAVEEGETRNALKELNHPGTDIKPILLRAPHLQYGAGSLKPFSGLPLGEALGLQVAIRLEEFSTWIRSHRW